jgi:hypothetical protein
VRVLQGAGGKELLLEPPEQQGLGGHVGFEHLDGHQAVGAAAARLEDRAAAAPAQLGDYLVRS